MLTGLTEPFCYHPFVVWSAIKGFKDLIIKKKGWGEMTRTGLTKKAETVPITVAVSAEPVTTLQTTVTVQQTAAPVPVDLIVEGAPGFKAATLPIILHYGTVDPLS